VSSAADGDGADRDGLLSAEDRQQLLLFLSQPRYQLFPSTGELVHLLPALLTLLLSSWPSSCCVGAKPGRDHRGWLLQLGR
jgi:hypothetical protein